MNVVVNVEKVIPPVVTTGCRKNALGLPIGTTCGVDHQCGDETKYHSINRS